MMNQVPKLALSLLIISVVMQSGCGYVYRSGFVKIPRQTISGPVEIGPDWVEFVPSSPLIPYGGQQSIQIGFLDYDRENFNDDPKVGNVLKLADGRRTKVEVVVYDESGEAYELRITGSGGAPPGIWFNRRFVTEKVDGRMETRVPSFPGDRTYTKVRMRSEVVLKCERIDWVGENNK